MQFKDVQVGQRFTSPTSDPPDLVFERTHARGATFAQVLASVGMSDAEFDEKIANVKYVSPPELAGQTGGVLDTDEVVLVEVQ